MLALTGALHFLLMALARGLVGVVTTNRTTGNRTYQAMMTGNVACHAADDCTFDASLGAGRRSERNTYSRSADQN